MRLAVSALSMALLSCSIATREFMYAVVLSLSWRFNPTHPIAPEIGGPPPSRCLPVTGPCLARFAILMPVPNCAGRGPIGGPIGCSGSAVLALPNCSPSFVPSVGGGVGWSTRLATPTWKVPCGLVSRGILIATLKLRDLIVRLTFLLFALSHIFHVILLFRPVY